MTGVLVGFIIGGIFCVAKISSKLFMNAFGGIDG